ncbi:MAG TPA: M15 family metallopeptidase [Kofleriaceae bacterium]|nr:M15 family metallopeptidase [Kofleriaceae bacterium]
MSAVTVASFITSSCSTSVVVGLSNQIASEISCTSPSSLSRFAAGSGITFNSNSVLPFLAANAKTDLQKVGNVQLNSAFRTVAQQFLIVEWFNRGRCGITAAAAPGRSNHESGRAVDVQNFSARVSAMASHGWSHDVPGDPVHFDHLSSADIRGRDTLAFQRLWNRNHPGDKIAADGAYGPQTEARLRQSPATGFATGATCLTSRAVGADVVAIDGPDRVAPGTKAHFTITLNNTTSTDWPATTRMMMASGSASELYDSASWTSTLEIGQIGVAIPAGEQGVVEVNVVAPGVATETPVSTEIALTDGDHQVGTITLSMTVTPNGDENQSNDRDDQFDDEVSGGCSAGGSAGWLAFAPVLLVLRRRRR